MTNNMTFPEFKARIYKWEGSYNGDARCWNGGYLYFTTSDPQQMTGKAIRDVTNRSQAIKKAWELYQKGEFTL